MVPSARKQAQHFPLDRVRFEFVILSKRGEPINEAEFSHELLLGQRARHLSRDARILLQRDCLTLHSEHRQFVDGHAHREPEIFRACRHLANVGQISMAPTDHDLIVIGRGAFRLHYDGPTAHNQAQLELMVHAAETVRSLRPGLIVDRHARQIWGEHSWESQLTRHNGLGAREHFKIEMTQGNGGIRLSTRGLAKFGLPDLRMESLPHDLSGMGAISITSIALDLIYAEGALDPARLLSAPGVRGRFRFDYQPPTSDEEYPIGAFSMMGGIDGEEPSKIGLLEVLSRLHRQYVDGESFHDQVDEDVQRRAQESLSRLNQKFAQADKSDRLFLVRRILPAQDNSENWVALSAIEGSTYRGKPADQSTHKIRSPQMVSFDQSEICDWMILRGGDIEDGGFGMKRM